MNLYKNKIRLLTIIIVFLIVNSSIIFDIQNHPVPWAGNFITGLQEGHIPQVLLMWNLPIYTLLIAGDKLYFEKKDKLLKLKLMRSKHYILKHLIYIAIYTFIIFTSILLINLILALIFFHGNTHDFSLTSLMTINTPYLTVIFYSVLNGLYFSSITVLTSLFGLLFKRVVDLYAFSFAFHFCIVTLYSSKMLQAFNEYRDQLLKFTLFHYALVFILCFLIYTFYNKKDNI